MLSSLVKLLRAVFSNETPSIPLPSNESGVIETERGRFTTRWSFRGCVTEAQEGCGMIEDQVYFTIHSVNGTRMPVVGSTVDVVAERKHGLAGWRAVSVSVVSEASLEPFNWDYKHAEVELLPESSTGRHYFTAKVTKELPKGGVLDGIYEFDLSDVSYDDYRPCRGDWVIAVHSSITTMGNNKVRDVRPLRTKHFDGVINAVWHGSHGYVDSSIYFTWNICVQFEPSRFDKVCGEAVEVDHKSCKWRAFKLHKVSHDEDGVKDLQTAELNCALDENGDIDVTPVDFGQMQLGQRDTKIMCIRNKGLSSVVLKKYFLSSGSSQFTFTEPLLKDEEIQKYSPETGLYIQPGKSAVIKIECSARNLGCEDRLFILEFEGFKCSSDIKVDVTDCIKSLIEPSNQYHHIRNSGRRRYEDGEMWIVPGQRPLRSGAVMKLPQKLKQYSIPEAMRQWMQDQKDLTQLIPALAEPLRMSNYTRRFSALLHIEELAMEEDMKQYDIDQACLEPYLDFLRLEVPGLAEGRPSLLVGDRVYLSSPLPVQQGPLYEGFIHQVLKDSILLKFSEEFHRTYDGEEYHVSFTFNRTSLRRSHKAVELVTQLGEQVLFPEKIIPRISQYYFVPRNKTRNCEDTSVSRCTFFNNSLNYRQKAAVVRILRGESRPAPYILFGPPGTGKTITIVEVILQIIYRLPHSRILACTPSNSAADLLVERLHKSCFTGQIDMVRLNAFQRQDQSIPDAVLPYCSDGEDIERVIHHRVIICTCVTAGTIYSLGPKAGHFTHVIVDEAGQATEPECMVPIGLLTGTDCQIVLAGDPMQLGPVLRSYSAKDLGLGQSFLERLSLSSLYSRDEERFADYGNYNPELVTKLVQNYRSHPAILSIPSQLFYDGELQISADPELTKCLCLWNKLTNNENFPLLFHGIRGEDIREGSSPSWFNPMEAVQVMRYLNALIDNDLRPLTCDDIGVITPYRKQVEKIRLLIDKLGMDRVKVGSVEEFQGQERLVMIISTVRSGESGINHDIKYNLGFISNPKRFNVAITRAQALLVIIGNPHALVKDPCWKTMIQYCVANNAYTGCDLPRDVVFYESVQRENNNVDDKAPRWDQQMGTQNEDLNSSSRSTDVSAEARSVRMCSGEEGQLSLKSGTDQINSTSPKDNQDSRTRTVDALSSKQVENSNENHVRTHNDIKHLAISSQVSRITVSQAVSSPSSSSSSSVMSSVNTHTTPSTITYSYTSSSYGNNHFTSASSPVRHVTDLSDVQAVTTAAQATCTNPSCVEPVEQQPVESLGTKPSLSGYPCAEQTLKDCSVGGGTYVKPSVQGHVRVAESVAEHSTVESLPVNRAGEALNIASVEKLPPEIASVAELPAECGLTEQSSGAEQLPAEQSPAEQSSLEQHMSTELPQNPNKQSASKDLTQGDTSQQYSVVRIGSDPDLLEQKIIRQIEYYFGDINLRCDKFLLEKISQHPEHYVPLSVIMTFNRMKSLTSEVKVVVDALRKSTSGLVEVHPDGSQIRRSPQRPLPADLDEWKNELKNRAIAVEGFTRNVLIDDIQDMFESLASVEHVHRGIRKYLGNRRMLFADLVIFTTEDGAKRVACLSDELYHKHHLIIYYREKMSNFCVQKFFMERIIQGQGYKQVRGPRGEKKQRRTAMVQAQVASADVDEQKLSKTKNVNSGAVQNNVKMVSQKLQNNGQSYQVPKSSCERESLKQRSSRNRRSLVNACITKPRLQQALHTENSPPTETGSDEILHSPTAHMPNFGLQLDTVVRGHKLPGYSRGALKLLSADENRRMGRENQASHQKQYKQKIPVLKDVPLSDLDLHHMATLNLPAEPSENKLLGDFHPGRKYLSEKEFVTKDAHEFDLRCVDTCQFKDKSELFNDPEDKRSNNEPEYQSNNTLQLSGGVTLTVNAEKTQHQVDHPQFFDSLEQTDSDVIIESSEEDELEENWT